MEKKMDKDNLINQIYDYLTQEVSEHYKTKELLSRELYQDQKEKDRKVKDVSDQNRIYQIRKVFSPLDFEEETKKEDNMVTLRNLTPGSGAGKKKYRKKKIRFICCPDI